MKNELYIPKKIRIGFQKRDDTFTNMLAYIIYFDDKGVLRKEGSWEGWRDKEIPFVEFDNVPTSGYVLNKGIKRFGYHSNSGRSVIRIHDPREFEFEITVDNLVGILMNTDSSKREIQGECIFAWAGKDLILLPVGSEEYKASQEFTKKQSLSISTKSLKKGSTYVKKKGTNHYVYIGYHEWFDSSGFYGFDWQVASRGKKHIFYSNGKFEPITPNLLAECVLDDIVDNYPELVELFDKSEHSGVFTGFKEEPINLSEVYLPNTHWLEFIKDYGKSKAYKVQIRNVDPPEYYNESNNRYSDHKISFTFHVKSDKGYSSYGRSIDLGYDKKPSIESKNPDERLYAQILEQKDMSKTQLLKRLNDLGFRNVYVTREDGSERRIN